MSHISNSVWNERYAIAQSLQFAADLVANGTVYPHWIDDEYFWYERRGRDGAEYRVVAASTGQARAVLTKCAVARSLSVHLDAEVDSQTLLLRDLKFARDISSASFNAFGEAYLYRLADKALIPSVSQGNPNWVISPDGRLAAFLRDYNLWIREIHTGREWALTQDGSEHYAYADTPAAKRTERAWLGSAPPEGRWSPDSKRFFTLRVDDRHVPELPMIDFVPDEGVRPRVSANRTSLPGDSKITEFRMICIDIATGKQIEARYGAIAAVRMIETPFTYNLTWWHSDSRTAYFVDVPRGEKAAHVIAFDTDTGVTRGVFSETSDASLELSVNVYAPALIYPLPATNELVWYSERTGHGHLYLYDLGSGEEKHAITGGSWQVRDVQKVDETRREIFFTAAGIAPDEDPYVCKPCVAPLDGGRVTVVSADRGEHIVWRPREFGLVLLGLKGGDPWAVSGLSPSGNFFVETVGSPDRLPCTFLRRRSGELIATLEIAEDRGLPTGWTWPEPVKLKAADGITDTYGLLFKPWNYEPSTAYPVIDYIYAGPQISFVPKSAFALGGLGNDLQYQEAAHLSALGAFVILLDGRGTANRERAFRVSSYGAVQTASNIDDHITGIRQLAARYPSIDLERVGVCGFSAGGYGAALAAVQHGDFFKVAVAGGGNYDQSLFWHSWGERYHGLFEPKHYANQAVKTYAQGLTGKLMLFHGLMDSGCHPAALFQLIQALIEQNKDFDLVLLPRASHAWPGYAVRRRLDYFVTHLFGSTPPKGAKLTSNFDQMERRMAANSRWPQRHSSEPASQVGTSEHECA